MNKFYFLLLAPLLSFGFNVGDRVWNDANQDWEQDANETGYPNVTVELYNSTQQKLQTVITNANGYYNFSNVTEGEYRVKVLPPQGVNMVTTNNVALWVDSNRSDIDFGLTTHSVALPTTYIIGDKVWHDKNEDWEQNQTEEGLANVRVELYSVLGQEVDNVTTDAQGNYLFTNIPEGEYRVKVVPNAGMHLVTSNNRELWLESNRSDIDFGLLVEKNVTITINELLTANSTTNFDPDYKQFSDWIELYNDTNSTFDIGGYYLSNDIGNLEKWYIPEGTSISAKGYLLVWADKEDDNLSALHTNFKLSQKGGTVVISNRDGIMIDSITYPKQKPDISCGKDSNTGINYMIPSPNHSNYIASSVLSLSTEPSFSLSSGFYNGGALLTLSQPNGAVIFYTLDGSTPTFSSTIYNAPIDINQTMVIRARALEPQKFFSPVVNRTYLIDENITLPVVSIGIDNQYLYDNTIGIYKNYNERWRRAGSVEYIKNGESKFSKNVGIRIFGGTTRVYPQKSLAIFAKGQYGSKSIKYPLFPDKPQIKKVKSFILRNSGNDWGYTMMKDGLVHNIVKGRMDIDYQSYHPTVVFLNGQYWGIHNLREKMNEDYLQANHGVNPKKVDVLEGQYEVKEGSNIEYLALLSYIQNNPLSDTVNYNYVASKINIDEYINYMIIEIYGGNMDWPYTNIKYWRKQSATGKWRWMLYDTDRTFERSTRDIFALLLDPNSVTEPNPAWSTFLFRNLMLNSTFKQKFVTTFNQHLNTTFKPSRIDTIIDTMKSKIKPEIQRHFNKWPRRDPSDWENGDSESIAELHKFALERADNVKAQLLQYFP